MYINTFKYTPKDVSCQLCTEYVKKLTSLGVYLNVLIYMGASFWHENSGQTNCLSAHRL